MIRGLQDEHRRWLEHNFPNQKPYEPLLGITEEVGELSHAYLKAEQNIREAAERMIEPRWLMADALGDIFIYMMSFCNANGLDLETCITDTWMRVKQRDWVADPIAGGEEVEEGDDGIGGPLCRYDDWGDIGAEEPTKEEIAQQTGGNC